MSFAVYVIYHELRHILSKWV